MHSSVSNSQEPPAQCFAPIIDADVRILILGSLPGRASLSAGRYYAHPRNQFWQLMSAVLDEDLTALDYEARLSRLCARHIGLWDAVAQAKRRGSLDSAIQEAIPNDLPQLLTRLPNLKLLAFNGKKAAHIGQKGLSNMTPPLRFVSLPSSSPALTLPFSTKAAHWTQALSAAL